MAGWGIRHDVMAVQQDGTYHTMLQLQASCKHLREALLLTLGTVSYYHRNLSDTLLLPLDEPPTTAVDLTSKRSAPAASLGV